MAPSCTRYAAQLFPLGAAHLTSMELFRVGAYLLVAHVAFSFVLQLLLRGDPDSFAALFAVPNRPLVPAHGLRLLRARLFLPWEPAPPAITRASLIVRCMFWGARLTGFVTPLYFLLLLGAAVWVGTR